MIVKSLADARTRFPMQMSICQVHFKAMHLAANPIHNNTFIVLVTRNVKVDLEIIPLAFSIASAPYIGVMGSSASLERDGSFVKRSRV